MRFFATAIALLAMSVSAPVVAEDPKPAVPTEETEKKKEKKAAKKICRRISDMGSRRSKRMCMTRNEWREFNQGN